MARWLCLSVVAGAAASALPSGGLCAQFSYGGDLTFAPHYTWRGLTRDGGWVAQPDVFVSFGGTGARATLGVWSSIELGSRDAGALRLGRRWWGETDPWLELACHCLIDVAAGWTSYVFAADARDPGPLRSTGEFYVRLQDLDLPIRIVPQLGVWYDPSVVHGTYLEASAIIRVPFWSGVVIPLGSLTITPTIGYSAGQEVNQSNPAEAAYFEGSGFTHFSVTAALTAGEVPLWKVANTLRFETHFQRGIDARTQAVNLPAAPTMQRTQWWIALSLTVLGPRCRPARGLCPRS